MPPKSSMTEAEFAAMARRAGLRLDPAQLAEMHGIHGYLEEMQALVRQPRGLEVEPAHILPMPEDGSR